MSNVKYTNSTCCLVSKVERRVDKTTRQKPDVEQAAVFGAGVCKRIYGAGLLRYITATALDKRFITKLLVFCNRSCLYTQGNRGNSLGFVMEASNLSEALASIVPGAVAERVADELRTYLAGKGL